jgi:hypothetical protein
MVICSECGTRVPQKVILCPKCGASVDATGVGPSKTKPRREPLPWWAFAVALVALAAAGFGAYVIFR